MAETTPPNPTPVTLHADDGYQLAAMLYRAQGALRGRLVIGGATGVPQGFYRRFAQHAAEQGFETLTLDYRGIGLSRYTDLSGFKADFLQWATQDLAAAIDYMGVGTTPLFLMGHSFGGHAFGLLPNHEKVAGFYTFGTGAGWHGWMPRSESLRVRIMWNLVSPVITWWKGYLAWSSLGMGEDLPLGVYRQWKRWCSFPRYFFDDPQMRLNVQQRFATVRTPIVAANATDDLWAPPASRDAFMAGYRNAPMRNIDIAPRSLGLEGVGHMGYFRPNAKHLWENALDWFATHTTAQSGAPA